MIPDFLSLTRIPQKVVSISAFESTLAFRKPFLTAKMRLETRPLVLVRVETDLGVGWGECSALPDPFYNNETTSSCFNFISNQLSSQLSGRSITVEQLSNEADSTNSFSFAAIEMALLYNLIESSGSLNSFSRPLPYGPVISLSDSVNSEVADCVAAGAKRIKLKVSSKPNIEQVSELCQTFGDVRFDADANGSFKNSDFETVVSLYKAGIRTLEQPFDPKDTESAQRLVESCEIGQLVCADEAAATYDSALRVIETKAANAVCIKPSRLGGLYNAVALATELEKSKTDFMFGGMLESSLGRTFLAIAIAICQPTLVGDLTPSSFLYADQPSNDLELRNGSLHLPVRFS